MKIKSFISSIVLHSFLGYLWLLFINHHVTIVNKGNMNFFVGGLILIVGMALFGKIIQKVARNYKLTHPVKLAGIISFILIITIHVFIIDLV